MVIRELPAATTAISSAKVAVKLAAIMGDLGIVGKDKQHGMGFAYASVDAVYEEVQPLMSKHGLAFTPEITKIDENDTRFLVFYEYAIIDCETGETIRCPWVGEGIHTTTKKGSKQGGEYSVRDEKTLAKIHSLATKYFLCHLLMIPRGDLPDLDENGERIVQRNGQKPSGNRSGGNQKSRKQNGKPAGKDPEAWPSPTTVDQMMVDFRKFLGNPDYPAEGIARLAFGNKLGDRQPTDLELWGQFADVVAAKKALANLPWPCLAALDRLCLEFREKIEDPDCPAKRVQELVGMESRSDMDALKKFSSRADALEAIWQAFTRPAGSPPTPPEEIPPTGEETAPTEETEAWTDFDEHALNEEAQCYGFDAGDIEEAGQEALEILGKPSWRDFPNRNEASVALRALAIERKLALTATHYTYRGQYTELHCNHTSPSGGVTVRVLHRTAFHSVGGKWKEIVKSWPKHKGEQRELPYGLNIRSETWEEKGDNFVVAKGGLSPEDIPF